MLLSLFEWPIDIGCEELADSLERRVGLVGDFFNANSFNPNGMVLADLASLLEHQISLETSFLAFLLDSVASLQCTPQFRQNPAYSLEQRFDSTACFFVFPLSLRASPGRSRPYYHLSKIYWTLRPKHSILPLPLPLSFPLPSPLSTSHLNHLQFQ